jgi:hypothetical protein
MAEAHVLGTTIPIVAAFVTAPTGPVVFRVRGARGAVSVHTSGTSPEVTSDGNTYTLALYLAPSRGAGRWYAEATGPGAGYAGTAAVMPTKFTTQRSVFA